MTHLRTGVLAAALEKLLAHDWQAAHALVQDLDDRIACRIHGLVHRIEGDLANSRYWYGRAGAALDPARSVEDEIAEIRDRLGVSVGSPDASAAQGRSRAD